MSQPIESLPTRYERGHMSRRDLVALLTAVPQLQDVSFCGGVGALGNACRA
jgi:hypothetical protein